MINVTENILNVRSRISKASKKFDRNESEITLLAVSKKQSVEAIKQAIEYGLTDFGENYLQESESKIHDIRLKSAKWHYIGRIQSNKARRIASLFDWVHSVERFSIAQKLNDNRPSDLSPLNICLQVNIDNDNNKSGFDSKKLLSALADFKKLPSLKLRGLMAIPKQQKNSELTRASFANLHKLFIEAKNHYKDPCFDCLSMGMSGDMEFAIAEGSTMLRIGTDIFGPRD